MRISGCAWIFLLAIPLLSSSVFGSSTRSKKAVVVSLHSNWAQTSFLAECSEFLAKEGGTLFWDYINQIVENVNADDWDSMSDLKQHNISVMLAHNLIEESRIHLLKFALSLRAHSPVVQLYQKLGSERQVNCTAFAEVHGSVTCDPTDLENLVENAIERGPATVVYSIDHVYPFSESQNVTVVIYGEIGTLPWQKFHLAAKTLARNNRVKYILRHYVKDVRDDKVLLSGYGVELAIKSTEYKAVDDSATVVDDSQIEDNGTMDYADNEDVFGFNFNILRKLHSDSKESLSQFRLHLLEREELTPLKVWQVQDLSYQAAQYVIAAGPQKALRTLSEISQNFPLAARSLTRQVLDSNFNDEVSLNQAQFSEFGISEGDSVFSINGVNVDIDALDVFQILDLLKQEEKLANGFYRMGIKEEYLKMLLGLEVIGEKMSYALDFRSAFPEYLNDLDTDKQYRQWGSSVRLMLQPYFPGMLRPIARNMFTVIFVIDPSRSESYSLLKFAVSFHNHDVPIRLGFIFVVNDDENATGFDDASVAMFNLYYRLKEDVGPVKAVEALTKVYEKNKQSHYVAVADVLSYFQERYPNQDPNTVFGSESSYGKGRFYGRNFLENSGLSNAPKVLLNGVVLDDSAAKPEYFEEMVMMEIVRITPKLQKAVLEGKLSNSDNVMNWILSQPEVVPRFNKRILETPIAADALYLDFTSIKSCSGKSSAQFHKLPTREFSKCMMERMRYHSRTEEEVTHMTTVWVVTDLETSRGRLLAYNVIKNVKKSDSMRVAIINNPADLKSATSSTSFSMLVNVASRTLLPKQMKRFVEELIEEDFAGKLVDGSVSIDKIKVDGVDISAFQKEMKRINSDEVVADAKFSSNVLKLKPGMLAVVVNGLVIGPLDDNEMIDINDVQLFEKLVDLRGGMTVYNYIEKWKIQKRHGKSSDMITKVMSLIGASGVDKKRKLHPVIGSRHSVVDMPAKLDSGMIHVQCIIDPLTNHAQKLGHLIEVMSSIVNVQVQLIMNPKAKLSELPLKRFYRLVLRPFVVFDDSGRIDGTSYSARFTALPNKQLLTMSLVPPDAWMVESVYAVYDLDNIKMENVAGNVVAKFELEHILLEGHCFDDVSGSPPRGLQFTLGTSVDITRYDTIVMANLGYFQLKAEPGAWILRLREGKSTDLYEIVSHINTEVSDAQEVDVLIDSFSGRTIRVRVTKKKGKEKENLLSDGKGDDDEEQNSIWNSISSSITGGEVYDVINIFSLASGHLYERFLRIMMLSTMKYAKHPVKFWLLKNYLSPNFKETLPIMANHYGFQYELVEYRWPRWLNQQTEKQRVMWGYKIMFLDVLFPLDVRKIIFVDADQIVRTDLMELMEFDLGGAPYGFTPFCDSRKSMDGFRFWKQGYWASHLAGRKYHISALYVIDLVKFRQVAAGDRLRGQYQGLSHDPNSLSNLDQDLPNNMIHQVRIKSLPQEWLWCETWCSDASKAKAKTIDLCNNPRTKEPKLDSAIRIIPEWKDYDSEIKSLLGGNVKTEFSSVNEVHQEL